jgi:ABC-type multidrug transport system fused ATPase/permease subunit
MHHPYHDFVHWIVGLLGQYLTDQTPQWVHPFLHVALFWGPALFIILVVFRIAQGVWSRKRRAAGPAVAQEQLRFTEFHQSVLKFILKNSYKDQLALSGLGLLAMPVLYFTLELPKIIVNEAIDSTHFPHERFGFSFDQEEFLFFASALFLVAIFANGTLKYILNVYKGRVGERLLRRLRLYIYRRWHRGAGSERRVEVIPIIAQEVEPVGGFASDAFALPIFQGGTFVTILFFMFMQDPVLGFAALILLPVQLALIPRLQRRINALARERAIEVRSLSGTLGDEVSHGPAGSKPTRAVGRKLRDIESIRQQIHQTKFLMKALNNFLTALTPFFFYSVGGYLVIEESLSLGALIAVLAAYKDFSAPLRELFRYYQSYEDVRIRYQGVLDYIGSGESIHSDSPTMEQSALRIVTETAG